MPLKKKLREKKLAEIGNTKINLHFPTLKDVNEIYRLSILPTIKLPKNVPEDPLLKVNPTTFASLTTAMPTSPDDPLAITTEGPADMEDVQDLQESRKRTPQPPEEAIPKKTIIDVSLIGREHNYKNQVLKQKKREELREDLNFYILPLTWKKIQYEIFYLTLPN
ncbi:hypothetical protein SK128_027550 [Halocaridina rubra]|uniref:Uncharacterized protein n=1 Tax=Halocaridina rubra TaxID=373956 RepID=A0AAN8XI05_HALRR